MAAEHLSQRLQQAYRDLNSRRNARALWQFTYDRLSTQTLTSAVLAIKAGSSALVKSTEIGIYSVRGVLVTTADNTDMAALSGTVTNALFNVYCFFINAAGTLTSAMGTEGTTLALVRWPVIPNNAAMIGFVIINPTGTGNFVGGTTALDDGTVVPGAIYVNTVGAFDPSATYIA